MRDRCRPLRQPFVLVLLAAWPTASSADPAQILHAEARPAGQSWTVTVTVQHGDTGWDDYADGWRILTEDGDVIGTRVLAHPHVQEQPFTRSLSGVDLPDAPLFVESSTNTTGWSGALLPLSRTDG